MCRNCQLTEAFVDIHAKAHMLVGYTKLHRDAVPGTDPMELASLTMFMAQTVNKDIGDGLRSIIGNRTKSCRTDDELRGTLIAITEQAIAKLQEAIEICRAQMSDSSSPHGA